MMEILDMGKYGAYVWSSFSLTVMVMIACIVQARLRHRKIYQQVESRLKAMDPPVRNKQGQSDGQRVRS